MVYIDIMILRYNFDIKKYKGFSMSLYESLSLIFSGIGVFISILTLAKVSNIIKM